MHYYRTKWNGGSVTPVTHVPVSIILLFMGVGDCVSSCGIPLIPSFVEVIHLVKKLSSEGTYTHTHAHTHAHAHTHSHTHTHTRTYTWCSCKPHFLFLGRQVGWKWKIICMLVSAVWCRLCGTLLGPNVLQPNNSSSSWLEDIWGDA